MTAFKEAADTLQRHNRWRLDDDGKCKMPDPREITGAIDAAILALKIAQAAREWREAEQTKAEAKRRFADAVSACIDHRATWRAQDRGESGTVWYLDLVSGPDLHGSGWVSRWVYPDGSDASSDPRAIENQRAYAELKAARKAAGIKRAVLTRMLGRIKEGKQ